MKKHKSIRIDETTSGKRFDIAATEMLPMLSRAYVHVLIQGRRILLNGKQEKAGYKLRPGDIITTDFDPEEIDHIAEIELPIIFEDENVIVINKPEGVISHSRGRYWNEPSVASFVRQRTNQKGERSGIVHRLDRATSGVMICAKNAATLSFLQKQFNQRNVNKTYVALVNGHIKIKEAMIDMPIERNPKAPSTFRVAPNGKASLTKYRVLEEFSAHSLVELEPRTGRTHQLRVHMKQLKHPIVGDVLYGKEAADRLFLHALQLEVTLPEGNRKIFRAPLPNAFMEFEKSNQ